MGNEKYKILIIESTITNIWEQKNQRLKHVLKKTEKNKFPGKNFWTTDQCLENRSIFIKAEKPKILYPTRHYRTLQRKLYV